MRKRWNTMNEWSLSLFNALSFFLKIERSNLLVDQSTFTVWIRISFGVLYDKSCPHHCFVSNAKLLTEEKNFFSSLMMVYLPQKLVNFQRLFLMPLWRTKVLDIRMLLMQSVMLAWWWIYWIPVQYVALRTENLTIPSSNEHFRRTFKYPLHSIRCSHQSTVSFSTVYTFSKVFFSMSVDKFLNFRLNAYHFFFL